MHIRVGIENNIENRSLAWVLDHPGCFAFGMDEAEALLNLPGALVAYERWIKGHTTQPWVEFNDLDLQVVERYTTFRLGDDYRPALPGEGYEINAWFTDDWRPLSSEEIHLSLTIFTWQREELLAGLSTLDSEILERRSPGERWNILGISRHIANAELWYLSRLSITSFTHQNLDQDPETRLTQTAKLVRQHFPGFAGEVNVVGIEGEFWSFRKIIRRTLWHQRDHIDHIKQLALNPS